MSGRGLVGVLAAAIATLALATAVAAGGGQGAMVLVTSTGDHSELRNTVPVTRGFGDEKRVAMSLRPSDLPRLENGDRLRVSAELETTNDCLERVPRCVGSPYRYSPTISTRLVVARSSRARDGRAISPWRSLTCRQSLPNREHHCVTVFTGDTLEVPPPAVLPCLPADCAVNLVVSAHHPRAGGGDRVILGITRPNGSVVQDKGRVNAVRLTPGRLDGAKSLATGDRRRRYLGVERRQAKVVYSLRLRGLERNEQFAVGGRMLTDIAHLSYSTFVGAEIILATDPDATQPGRLGRRTGSLGGTVTEGTGFNCTQATTPCRTTKTGVLRILRDAPERSGEPIPFFLNLAARNAPKRVMDSPGDRIRIGNDGGLTARKYPAHLRG